MNVDLAPVLDTVPERRVRPAEQPPIGYYQREYGYDPTTVSTEGGAFAQGMADAGIDATVKHFPGLGRVTANTDTSSGVTDTADHPHRRLPAARSPTRSTPARRS